MKSLKNDIGDNIEPKAMFDLIYSRIYKKIYYKVHGLVYYIIDFKIKNKVWYKIKTVRSKKNENNK